MVEFAEKVTAMIVKLTDTLALAKDVMKGLQERITELENRQDTMWKALQGLMTLVNQQEQAIINLGKEVRDASGK